MKNDRLIDRHCLLIFPLVMMLILPLTALAFDTTIDNVREGLHDDYTRIVFDCSGQKPEAIGPARTQFLPVQFLNVSVTPGLDQFSGSLRGDVARIESTPSGNSTEIRLMFKSPDARVKTSIMPAATGSSSGYRLVVDIYPKPASANEQNTGVAAATTTVAVSSTRMSDTSSEIVTQEAGPIALAAETSESSAGTMPATEDTTPAEQSTEENVQASSSSDEAAAAGEGGAESDESDLKISGEASLILRSTDVDGSEANFDTYTDLTQPVTGDLRVGVEKNREYYLWGKGVNIGQDDQYVGAEGGRYGKYRFDASWNKFIHRYASDARTLYSGVGSSYMSLDDALQADIQAAPTSPEVATRLQGYMASAALGDPEVSRDQRALGFDLLALDPFSLRIDLANEKREGTRPFAGAFNNSQMVELFQPVDYDTTEMKVTAEYAQAPFMINAAYQYSQFKNDIGTLRFDNPLRLTDDAVAGSSSGLIDLAPDNQYQNFSLSAAMNQLPWRSQIVANAAWGRMTQDDALVPFTSNTAIAAPALPADRVDADVATTLYHFRLTSRPLNSMRLKGFFRYYDYDNQTGVIDFTNGYVNTDESLINTAVRNLPTSYTITRAGGEVGFDVFTRSDLNFGYTYVKTDRENREVAEQTDNIMKVSLDTRALDWLDIRTSYERTLRDIGDYRYDIYLESGEDLSQLPQLRKYDEADLTRDLFQVQATFYPMDALAFSGSASYGTDDFTDSPYGLTEDNRYVFSFDADYALGERLSFNLFYTHEIYENEQRAQGTVLGTPNSDWLVEGKDVVDTIGGGIKLAVIPEHLDLDLTYAYSDVDGNLEFYSPFASLADFSTVDDSKTHMLDGKLTYHNALGFDISVGYMWEKFDYSDFNVDGFTYVPTDSAGNYQGALLSGTLPADYDAHVIYTKITFRYH